MNQIVFFLLLLFFFSLSSQTQSRIGMQEFTWRFWDEDWDGQLQYVLRTYALQLKLKLESMKSEQKRKKKMEIRTNELSIKWRVHDKLYAEIVK